MCKIWTAGMRAVGFVLVSLMLNLALKRAGAQ